MTREAFVKQVAGLKTFYERHQAREKEKLPNAASVLQEEDSATLAALILTARSVVKQPWWQES